MRDQIPGQSRPKISNALVQVKLVTEAGTESDSTTDVLQGEGGVLQHPLDRDCKAKFYLKFLKTSNGANWRLLFSVEFDAEGFSQKLTQTILSSPFIVISNTKKKNPTRKS